LIDVLVQLSSCLVFWQSTVLVVFPIHPGLLPDHIVIPLENNPLGLSLPSIEVVPPAVKQLDEPIIQSPSSPSLMFRPVELAPPVVQPTLPLDLSPLPTNQLLEPSEQMLKPIEQRQGPVQLMPMPLEQRQPSSIEN
jgi:hypothetical protein